MRRIILVLGCAAALVGVLAAPVSAGSSGVTLATGSFTLQGDEQGSHRTFSFVVVEGPGGEITGQAQFITFGGDVVHIDIDCFTRVGNQAIVGGTSADLGGITVAFTIQDNPDIISFVAISDDPAAVVTCENLLELDNLPDITAHLDAYGVPIEQGNVVIRQAN
jgi:hypothetical protein